MSVLTDFLELLDGLLGSAAYFPIVLLGAGVFCVLSWVPQIQFLQACLGVLFGHYAEKEDPGDTSHFQALSTALSGTVGTGNIGGVAFAIFLGGPAALFWMWATAFVGMTTKFVEVSISHKYRKQDDQVYGRWSHALHGTRVEFEMVGRVFAVATVISSFGSAIYAQRTTWPQGMKPLLRYPAMSRALFWRCCWDSSSLVALSVSLLFCHLGAIMGILCAGRDRGVAHSL